METKGITAMVIGCGTMGSGIATSFLASPEVTLIVVENNFDMLEKLNIPLTPAHYGTLKEWGHVWVNPKILLLGSLNGWKNNFPVPVVIVEAVPEKIEMKKNVFMKVEELFGEKVIFGSNTSTLPLQDIANGLKYPKKFLGIHYNHPAHIIPIVEVIKLNKNN